MSVEHLRSMPLSRPQTKPQRIFWVRSWLRGGYYGAWMPTKYMPLKPVEKKQARRADMKANLHWLKDECNADATLTLCFGLPASLIGMACMSSLWSIAAGFFLLYGLNEVRLAYAAKRVTQRLGD